MYWCLLQSTISKDMKWPSIWRHKKHNKNMKRPYLYAFLSTIVWFVGWNLFGLPLPILPYCKVAICFWLIDCVLSRAEKKLNAGSNIKCPCSGFSSPYSPAFRLNMERYVVSLCIQSKCGKMQTRKSHNTDTFHAMYRVTANREPQYEAIHLVKQGRKPYYIHNACSCLQW